VEVGLRIASGSVTLASGLTVLLLVPEVYGPLRRVGANFHAAQDGRDAACDVRDLIDAETLPSGHAMPATSGTLSFNGVVVRVRTAESSQDGVGSGGSGPIGSGKHDDDIRDEHTGLAASGSARGLQSATVADRPAPTGVHLRTGPTGDRLHATDVPMLDRSVEPGELAVMVGASGSGKSLLLDAVRGRCALRSGTVSWAGTDVRAFDAQLWAQRVAFIPQRPTPSRDTAAEVAGAGLPVSRDEVVRALGEVGLADFLDRPTDQLSGGERRRVMVAYAALAARHGAALVLADEPTAQLDDAAAELVIDSLAGIAARGVTVLAATHDPRLVGRATSTDSTPGVATTDSTSRSRADARSTAAVTDVLSTAAVADARSTAAMAVAAEMTQAGVRQTSHSTRTPSTSEPRTPAPEAALSPSVDEAEAVQSRDTPPSLADLHRGENQSANQHAGAVSSEAAGDKATSAEAASGRASTPLHRGTPQSSDEIPVSDRIAGLATVRSVLRRVGVPRTKLTLAVVAGFLADAATLGLAGVAAWLLLRASEHPSVSVLLVPAAIVRGCGTTKGLFRYGERLASHDAGLSVLGEVRSSLIGRLARVRPDRTTTLATAGRVRSTVHDVDGMLDLVVRAAVPWTTTIVSLVGAVAITSAIATDAGAIMACSAVLLAVVIPLWITRSEVGGIQLRRHAERELASTVSDAAANIELHVDRGTVDVERRRVMAVVDRLDAVDAARSHRRTLVAMLVAAIPPCTVALTAVVVDPASVSRGMFGVLMLWPFAVLELASGATNAADGLAEGVVAARGVADAFDIPTEVHDGDVCDPAEGAEGPDPAGPAEGAEKAEALPSAALLVDQLRAQWTDESPSIGPVSFGGDGGDRITVEGPSGAGKSTLAAALVDYCPNDYDRFLVDGRDRSQVGGPGLRASVMWVDQQPWIADTTVAANLRIGHPDATDDELFEALGTVALDGWIRERPLGLNAPVGRNGSNLSGGEAHRLAIARASLAAHRTVVLDEPTSHLDAATERIMSERLDAALSDRFVITLAHSTDSGLHVRRHLRPHEQGAAQRQ
ncbi:MAG: ATP-binding cassette domain-containing protein, partial [Actinobacteria bacterium]|nr:ATP-binding cassette domain-containing protein [Actinomycetota bacterium]